MIKAKSSDVGRIVIYKSFDGMAEKGVITSVNKDYVFVKFNGSKHSQATLRRDLEWFNQNNK
jgi:hypothetical protein